MNRKAKMDIVFKIALIPLVFNIVTSLDVEDIKEFCPGNFITQDYNSSWENIRDFTSDVVYYVPLASKFNVFYLTQYLYQSRDFKLLTQSQLENSCLLVNKINGWEHLNQTGYDQSRSIRMFRTEIPKLYRFELPVPGGPIGGYASIALTDNESYTVFDYCLDNKLRGFAVIATSTFLDEISLAVIKSHLRSIGFKERNFLYLNYFGCFDTKGNLAPDPDSLPIPGPPFTSSRPPITFLPDNYLVSTYFFKKK